MNKIGKNFALFLALGTSVSTVGCAGSVENGGQSSGADALNYDTAIISSLQGETVALLEGDIYEFASSYEKGKSIEYADGNEKVNRFAPKPVMIVWENSRTGAEYYTLRLGLNNDLSDATDYISMDTCLLVEDLFAAKHYYYQIHAHYANDEVTTSQIFDFYTQALPRTIWVEGVSNTRDIGGYFTVDGKYQVKQGMVYRGGEVDATWGSITDAGKEKLLYTYGIKTDLDLRGAAIPSSPINDENTVLNYVNISAPYYYGIVQPEYKEALITEIKTFADPDNYPIYLHCSLGRDRAGTLAFLINALLGVSEADLYRDYEMSFFSVNGFADAAQGSGKIPVLLNNLDVLYDYLMGLGGDTLAENTEAFMRSYLGITEEEIRSIRNIMLEEI